MKTSLRTGNPASTIRHYLSRRQLYPFQVRAKPSAELGLVVVIPCFDEPDIVGTLESIATCQAPPCAVEVLVVVNAPESAPAGCLARNSATLDSIAQWSRAGAPVWLSCHGLRHDDLPSRFAGVGLARKIGMDEAADRLADSDGGVIVSLDADCRVAENYLSALYREFRDHPECPGLSIYFEHQVSPAGDRLHRAVAEYELHLRYYVAGQRSADFPYAFHTIGSAMACRAVSYAAQGGMNRRQGGEDFYFIQKLIGLGGYRNLTTTSVYPGIRPSHRVPFGTGPAARRAAAFDVPMETYAPAVFQDLRDFCRAAPDWDTDTRLAMPERFSPALRAFLDHSNFPAALAEIRANVAGSATFRKRLFRWFNAFRFMKFAQFASRHYYPKWPVTTAAREMAASEIPGDVMDLLEHFRRLDRGTGV